MSHFGYTSLNTGSRAGLIMPISGCILFFDVVVLIVAKWFSSGFFLLFLFSMLYCFENKVQASARQ
jgi:hypothetical protein